MKDRTIYLGLEDANGVELSYPGYKRQPVTFVPALDSTSFENMEQICFPPLSLPVEAVRLFLKWPNGEVTRCPLTAQRKGEVTDSFVFPSGSIVGMPLNF